MRRFELVEGKSNKFWEVSTEGARLIVRYGRIGTDGRLQEKELESPSAATAELDRLVREKSRKGYVETSGAPLGSTTSTEVADDSEAVQSTLKALADIEEWLTDHGATAIVERLQAGATAEALDAVESGLGCRLPPELRAVYRAHDGQDMDDAYRNTFFPYGLGTFLSLSMVPRLDMASRFILSPDHEAIAAHPERDVPLEWIHLDENVTSRSALLPDEASSAWWTFAWDENFAGVVHLRSGRVFQWAKDEGLSLVAPSFAAFLAKLADDLWNDRYVLERDEYADDDEPMEDRAWTWSLR